MCGTSGTVSRIFFDAHVTGIAHPAAVASTTWAMARHRLQLPQGFVEILRQREVLVKMEPQDASLTLWALAKLRSQLGQLPKLGKTRWSTHDASTAMWACATMQTKPTRSTLDIWCNTLLEKMHLCTQQVGNHWKSLEKWVKHGETTQVLDFPCSSSLLMSECLVTPMTFANDLTVTGYLQYALGLGHTQHFYALD